MIMGSGNRERVSSKKTPFGGTFSSGRALGDFRMTEGSHFVSDLPAQEAFGSPQKE